MAGKATSQTRRATLIGPGREIIDLRTTTRGNIDVRTLFIALAALSWAFLLAPSIRGQSFDINGTGYNVRISVISTGDKTGYDTVIESALSYKVAISGRCPEKWKLKSAKIRKADGTAEFLPVDTDNRSISPDHGATSRFISIISNYKKPDLDSYNQFFAKQKPVSYLTNACENELNRLVKEGKSRTRLLQDGFDMTIFKAYDAELEVWCKDDHIIKDPDRKYTAHTDVHAVVRCEGTGYQPPRRTTPPGAHPPKPPQRTPPPPPPLTAVSVEANQDLTKGKSCPVYVTFSGKISANPDSQFATFNTRYRFIGENNYQSPWVNVSIKRGETRTVVGRRFIQTPKNNPGGTIASPGGKPKIPLHNGWMMLEVDLPIASKKSGKANFSVDCNPVNPGSRIKASN
ncbi:MAG TPA: hypothetical protein VIB00_10560 [Pyrinomonadaceae bacterium]